MRRSHPEGIAPKRCKSSFNMHLLSVRYGIIHNKASRECKHMQVAIQSDICDRDERYRNLRYLTEPDIGTSDIGLSLISEPPISD
jgi:hypothetical protein